EARDRERQPKGADRERSPDDPENADEGDGGQQGVREADDEIDQRFGREAHIVGDPVLRIASLAPDDVEL
ncbi:MAG: hypothetical protein AVDCRST_MAG90-685, partial [uncultured Microvirga sp.]